MIKLIFQFFSFVILFNLFVSACLVFQMPGFVERHGTVSLVLFFWFKVIGLVLSILAEYVFNLRKKKLFLCNIGYSPTKILGSIYLIDLIFYLFLCVLIVVYI
ncbi:hypothetical protein BWD42_09240 [Sphingobacterium sp. CZ-UAM]|nr:hypothetical protein BWD42_09240 [Sphingobacterium sp. CZ-UAM]